MTNALKKIYIAITGMLIAVTAQVNGADCNPAPSCAPSCFDMQIDNVYFTGELLYWTPQLCGLEAAFGSTAIATIVSGDTIVTIINETDQQPQSKWSPGFRVGAGVLLDCYDLDLQLDWTHFDGRAEHHANRQHGNWKIGYDVIDLTCGRYFCFGSRFYAKPFIGVRGLKIHQRLKSHLETDLTSLIGSSIVFTDKNDKENFWGIGPQIGLEADFYLGCDFSIFGSVGVVSYYGRVRGHNLDTDTFSDLVLLSNGKRKRCFDSIGTDAALGICWNRCWTCSCYEVDLMLKLGVEQHRIYEFSELGSDGTLSLDGGFFGAGVSVRY